jgi:hypothetical protein
LATSIIVGRRGEAFRRASSALPAARRSAAGRAPSPSCIAPFRGLRVANIITSLTHWLANETEAVNARALTSFIRILSFVVGRFQIALDLPEKPAIDRSMRRYDAQRAPQRRKRNAH